MYCGYAYLARNCCRSAFPPRVGARVDHSVSRITRKAYELLVPASSAPTGDCILSHALFALRHEGLNLQILAEVLPKVPAQEIHAAAALKPNSVSVRRLAYLWERFTGGALEDVHPAGRYVGLFDPDRYWTAPGERNRKWRVEFNGLGSFEWCATVEKTEALLAAAERDVLGSAAKWFSQMGDYTADRTLGWAYLSETKNSFALERESVSESKAERFARLLRHAHERRDLTEEYLCELQNEIVSNPFSQAFSWRTQQNWLGTGGHGVLAVRYVPPSPELLDQLMPGWLSAANALPTLTDPLIAAAVISFGFVYLHPFMDGNGRLSRFLIHQQLGRSGRLAPGQLLPVSVAMQKHEDRYLRALTAFSAPARSAWEVTQTGNDGEYECVFKGSESMYRYWQATEQTEFLFDMAEEALHVHLRQEELYLRRFDRLDAAVNGAFDLVQKDRHALVNAFLAHGRISLNFRKKFSNRIPPETFDWLEANSAHLLEPMPEDAQT